MARSTTDAGAAEGAPQTDKPARRRRSKAALATFLTMDQAVVVVDVKSGSVDPVFQVGNVDTDERVAIADAFIAGARWAGGAQ